MCIFPSAVWICLTRTIADHWAATVPEYFSFPSGVWITSLAKSIMNRLGTYFSTPLLSSTGRRPAKIQRGMVLFIGGAPIETSRRLKIILTEGNLGRAFC